MALHHIDIGEYRRHLWAAVTAGAGRRGGEHRLSACLWRLFRDAGRARSGPDRRHQADRQSRQRRNRGRHRGLVRCPDKAGRLRPR